MLLELQQNQIGHGVRKGMSEQLLQFCLLQLSKLGKILTTMLNIRKKMFSSELQQWTQPCNKTDKNPLKRANITAHNLCLSKLNLKRNCSLSMNSGQNGPRKTIKNTRHAAKLRAGECNPYLPKLLLGKGKRGKKLAMQKPVICCCKVCQFNLGRRQGASIAGNFQDTS